MDANYTSYLFENQMLEVGEEESRNISEANQEKVLLLVEF